MIGYREFPREIQLTNYTCGPCSAFAITSFFGVDVGYREVKRALKTDADGTSGTDIVRFLRSCGLRVSPRNRMTWRELSAALYGGGIALVDLDGDHCGVVHGMDDEDVYLMDPSPVRTPGRRLSIAAFKKRWDRSGAVVRPKWLPSHGPARRPRCWKGEKRLT